MNNVNLMGRLTADPELRQTNNGLSVCSVSIAVNRPTKDEQGNYKADFINLQAWRHTAEFLCKYFKKGDMLGLTGAIQTRTYQDKDTGKNRTAFEIVVSQVYFAGSKNESGNKSNFKPATNQAPTIDGPTQQSFTPEPTARFATGLDDFTEIASDDGDLPF